MSDLKSSYERELLHLRRGLSEFGSRNARVAGRLSVQGEQSEDMHVERLMQSAALLNARVRERLDDDVPDFTVPLLEVLYPEFLRPFPACSIACFEPGAAVERIAKPAIIKRAAISKRVSVNLDFAPFTTRCAPVINLFQCQAEPIALKDATLPTFPMVPQKVSAEETNVWSVSSVRLTYDNDGDPVSRNINPLYSLEHYRRFETASSRRPMLYWTQSNQKGHMAFAPGGACVLSFVTAGGEATEPARDEQIHATLMCSNGDAPGFLQWGAPEGDFAYPDRSVVGKITLLSRPTDCTPREVPQSQYWNVIRSLAAGPFSLDRNGLPSLKALLEAHIPPGAHSASGQINAIVGLSRETAMEWIVEKPQSRMARGLRVRLVIDETAFVDAAIVGLARVLESVFVRYAPAHSFVQLVLVSANNGSELARGQLLPGAVPFL